jgi:arylformamidase
MMIRNTVFILLGIILIMSVIFALQGFDMSFSARKRNFADVSHVIEDGMITYKGIPAPAIAPYLTREASTSRYAEGVQFLITKIEMVANTGTYLDAPYHRYEDGADLSALELENLAYLDAIIIRVNGTNRSIDESYFKGKALKGKAVLIHTGWDKHWRTEAYFENHPFITGEAARFLAREGVKLVGIDSYNIDDTNDKTRPAHSILLKEGIPIVEHLCDLGKVPAGQRIEFNAVPVRVKGFSTFPVRAFVTW